MLFATIVSKLPIPLKYASLPVINGIVLRPVILSTKVNVSVTTAPSG